MTRLFAILLPALVLVGCSNSNKFTEHFQKPAWFDSVEAPTLGNSADVDKLWQSEARCCEDEQKLLKNNRIFYKACYNGIADHFDDEALVVKCLWLMDIGAEKQQAADLTRFLVENYSHHKNRVDDCANCMPGDTIARATLNLARIEMREAETQPQAGRRVEAVLDKRGREISYWVKAELYTFLAQRYLDEGLTPERLSRFKAGYAELDKAKEGNEALQRRFSEVQEAYDRIIAAESGAAG